MLAMKFKIIRFMFCLLSRTMIHCLLLAHGMLERLQQFFDLPIKFQLKWRNDLIYSLLE